MLIDGIHVPLAEPFYRDGGLYLRKLEHNVRRYSLSPVSGLVALPPRGEASSLTDREAQEVFAAVAASAAREKVLVAGVERDSVRGALELAEAAETAGFDALLVAAPRNWQSLISTSGMFSLALFFRSVADASALPLLLWSDTATGGYSIPLGLIAELSAHPGIIGIYDAELTESKRSAIAAATSNHRREYEVTTTFGPVTRRMKKQEAVGAATFVSAESLGGGSAIATATPSPALKTRKKTVGFQIMAAGRSEHLVPLLEAGIAGSMPTLATCVPQASYEVYAAFKDGDPMLSIEKATRLAVADELMAQLGPAGVKYGSDLNGYFGGMPRLPRLPLKEQDRARVDAALRELRN